MMKSFDIILTQVLRQDESKNHVSGIIAAAWAILSAKYAGDEVVCFREEVTENGTNESISEERDVEVSVHAQQTLQNLYDATEKAATLKDGRRYWKIQLAAQIAVNLELEPKDSKLVVVDDSHDIEGADRPSAESPAILITWTTKDTDVTVCMHFTQPTSTENTKQLDRVCSQFANILRALYAGTTIEESKVCDVDVMSEEDISEIMRWNATIPASDESCVHELIAKQASKTPLAPAIAAWDGELTYTQLEDMSCKLARHLVSHGVGPESLVPVCFEKSLWAIVSMLAILKAGGACVPLDPTYPSARRQIILEDLKASVVLASPMYKHLFSAPSPVPVIVSSALLAELADNDNDKTSPLPVSSPGNAVFVVFTSGSTGQPKGIIIEHRMMCSSARDHGIAMRFSERSRVLQFAAYTFDDSFSDIFTTLMFGGCICIPSDNDRMNNLPKAIADLKANQACLTVTVARQLQPSENPSLEVMTVGGEAVTDALLQQWADSVYLINGYGPAECSIFCSGKTGLSKSDDASNVGTAWGCLLWITDASDHNKLVPIGAVGELLVEGPIVARGYLNNVEKTKAAFITDPPWLAAEKLENYHERRLYKTGDLARYNPDGTVQILGRKDSQVKLRGQRIELGEIEYHIHQYFMASAQVAVELVTPSNGPGLPTLAAIICLSSSSHQWEEQIKGLKIHLQQVLPSYMLPSLFVPILEMPLMVSGKLNRKELRVIAAEWSANEHDAALAPKTEAEKLLQRLWAEVLNLPPDSITVKSDFLRMGGDSFRAMSLAAAAMREGFLLSVITIFRTPQLSAQALSVKVSEAVPVTIPVFSLVGDTRTISQLWQEIKVQYKIKRQQIEDMYPCTPQQEDIITRSLQDPRYYISRYVYTIPPALDVMKFKQAWEAVVKRTPILRTRLLQTSKGYFQVVLRESLLPWREWNNLDSFLARDSEAPTIINADPIRAAIITSSDEHCFFFEASHAICDKSCLQVVLQAVEDEYNGHRWSDRSGLNIFVQYLNKLDIDGSKEYWKHELINVSSCSSYPPLPSADYQSLPDSQIERFVQTDRVPPSETTLTVMLRATMAIVLAHYASPNNNVMFATSVSGLDTPIPQIRNIIGPISATVPLIVSVNQDLAVSQFIQQLQKQVVTMMPFEQTGASSLGLLSIKSNFLQSLLILESPTMLEDGMGTLGLRRATPEILKRDNLPYGLCVRCRKTSEGIQVIASFDSAVIDEEKVGVFLDQFESVFQQVVLESPTLPLKKIEIAH